MLVPLPLAASSALINCGRRGRSAVRWRPRNARWRAPRCPGPAHWPEQPQGLPKADQRATCPLNLEHLNVLLLLVEGRHPDCAAVSRAPRVVRLSVNGPEAASGAAPARDRPPDTLSLCSQEMLCRCGSDEAVCVFALLLVFLCAEGWAGLACEQRGMLAASAVRGPLCRPPASQEPEHLCARGCLTELPKAFIAVVGGPLHVAGPPYLRDALASWCLYCAGARAAAKADATSLFTQHTSLSYLSQHMFGTMLPHTASTLHARAAVLQMWGREACHSSAVDYWSSFTIR
jgi:hypothetical protein